jgi:hypothetical protein
MDYVWNDYKVDVKDVEEIRLLWGDKQDDDNINFINEMIKIIHPINQILKISLTSATNV